MTRGSDPPSQTTEAGSQRIALLVLVAPHGTATELSVSELETRRTLHCEPGSFVLTLDAEPDATFTRGQLQSLSDRSTYPIQSNLAFFEAVRAFIGEPMTRQAGE